MKTRKVFILGGGGFIGSGISKILVERGNYDITIGDNFYHDQNDENFMSFINKNGITLYNEDFTDASQFEKLDKWIFDHKESLYQILNQDTILFGEWLYAKHSIGYNSLPDYFLAFDLYNKKKKLFYNRDILVNKLKNTTAFLGVSGLPIKVFLFTLYIPKEPSVWSQYGSE